jgi:hypothetical protein
VKTSFGKPPPKAGHSMLDLFIVFLFVTIYSFSLEEYLADKGSFEYYFFCLVSSSKKDPYHG